MQVKLNTRKKDIFSCVLQTFVQSLFLSILLGLSTAALIRKVPLKSEPVLKGGLSVGKQAPVVPVARSGRILGDSLGHGHGHGHVDEYNEKPDPFHFEYGVHDDKYHTDFSEHRSGDEAGNIKGEYTVALPDGRIQHVKYVADNYGGTTMHVEYSGEARHPDVVHHKDHGHGGHI